MDDNYLDVMGKCQSPQENQSADGKDWNGKMVKERLGFFVLR
jgi:hypothetical protein